MNIAKAKPMTINTRAVSEAVNCIVSAQNDFATSRKKVVNLLAKMNELERADWFDQVSEKCTVGIDLYRRMVAVATRGWVDSEHLYRAIKLVSHYDILTAGETASKMLRDPKTLIVVANQDGSVEQKQLSEATYKELRRAFDFRKGQVPPKMQIDCMTIKHKTISNSLAPAKILKCRIDGDHVTAEVEGYSRPIIMTKADIKNFVSMMM